MMFSVFIIGVILAGTGAEELDASNLEGFQNVIFGTIMEHLNAEYLVLQPAIAQQNQTMNACRERIASEQVTCRSCAHSECQGDLGDWIESQWGNVADWFQGAAEIFVDWVEWEDLGTFFGNVRNWFADAGNSLVNWNGWGNMGNYFSNAFGGFENFIGNSANRFGNSFGNFMSNMFSNLGQGVFNNFGQGVFKGIGSLIGRRRRSVGGHALTARRLQMIRHRYIAKRMEELTPEVRQCMEQCKECTPFLGDQTAMIGGVCGDQILLDQAAMADVMRQMEALFEANGHPERGTTRLVSKVEYDQSTCDFNTFTCGGVYITAVTPGGVERFPSQYRYNTQFPETTASEIAMEIIEKWNR